MKPKLLTLVALVVTSAIALPWPSLVRLKKMEQRVRIERSRDRKENAHGPRSSYPDADAHRRGTRHVGTLGASPDDRASIAAASASRTGVRERLHQPARRARAAADQTDRRQVAESVSDGTPPWLAGLAPSPHAAPHQPRASGGS